MASSLWVVWSSRVIFPAASEITHPEPQWLSADSCLAWLSFFPRLFLTLFWIGQSWPRLWDGQGWILQAAALPMLEPCWRLYREIQYLWGKRIPASGGSVNDPGQWVQGYFRSWALSRLPQVPRWQKRVAGSSFNIRSVASATTGMKALSQRAWLSGGTLLLSGEWRCLFIPGE